MSLLIDPDPPIKAAMAELYKHYDARQKQNRAIAIWSARLTIFTVRKFNADHPDRPPIRSVILDWGTQEGLTPFEFLDANGTLIDSDDDGLICLLAQWTSNILEPDLAGRFLTSTPDNRFRIDIDDSPDPSEVEQ